MEHVPPPERHQVIERDRQRRAEDRETHARGGRVDDQMRPPARPRKTHHRPCPRCHAPTDIPTAASWRARFIWSATWRLTLAALLLSAGIPLIILLVGIPICGLAFVVGWKGLRHFWWGIGPQAAWMETGRVRRCRRGHIVDPAGTLSPLD